MKNLLYIIAALLVVIWGILFWGMQISGAVHFLLVIAMIFVLVRLAFSKQLSNRPRNNYTV